VSWYYNREPSKIKGYQGLLQRLLHTHTAKISPAFQNEQTNKEKASKKEVKEVILQAAKAA